MTRRGLSAGMERLMANKTKATPQEEEALQKGPAIPVGLLPLLDLSDAAVMKLINQDTKRGYVTYEQLNAVMPSEEVTSEQIEDILRKVRERRNRVRRTRRGHAEDAGRIRG
jgi:RNA polymerase primary sigma factor